MFTRAIRSFAIAIPISLVAWACGNDDSNANGGTSPSGDSRIPLAIPCEDTIDSVYEDPGTLPGQLGAVIRCAPDGAMTKDEVQTALDAQMYVGEPMRTGVRVYRVLYRTERGNGDPGYSVARVYVPDKPRAKKVPTIVVSHGSRGQAGKCAPSLEHPDAVEVNDDQQRMVLTVAGAGFAVIAPDLAGFSNYGGTGNPLSGYNSSPDVARSTLDGARAMDVIVPGLLTGQVVLTGHSQGGHTAFSTLALAETYAPELNIAAVATFVPNWLSQRTWGALLLLASGFPFNKEWTLNAVSIWYHYTAAELMEGPGAAAKIFRPEKFDGVKKFVDETCWGGPYPLLEALGDKATDVFAPEFALAIQGSAGLGAPCPTDEPAKSTCEKWIARYLADRPHLTGKAATVPVLVNYGGKDDAIEPERFQCSLDRLEEDKINMDQCFDPEGMHGELPAQLGGFTVNWIANKTLGEPMVATCPKAEIKLVDGEGAPIKCAATPPND